MEALLISMYLAWLVQQTEIPGITPIEIAQRYPAMAGTSLTEPDYVATPGFFASKIGVKGTADNP